MNKPKRSSPEELNLPPVGIDTHAHLDLQNFNQDLEQVLNRAKKTGIVRIGNVFLGPDAYDENASRFANYPEIFFILGIHPHEACQFKKDDLSRIQEAFKKDKRIKALGEIGLDYFKEYSPKNEQKKAFQLQLELAKQLEAPVVIHSRSAVEDTLSTLVDLGFKDRPLLWHCFGLDQEHALKFLELGWTISIPGTLTFTKTKSMQAAVKKIPLNRLVLETDCPFLAPEPYRGKRNEPAFTAFTARKLAELKGQKINQVWEETGKTASRFFSLKPLSVK